MRDVESQIDSNRKKGEVMETPCAPVKGVPVTTEPQSAPVESAVEKQSGAPVKTEPEGAPVSIETESAPVQPAKDVSQSDPHWSICECRREIRR